MTPDEITKILPLIGTGSGAGVIIVTMFFLKALNKVSDSLDGLKDEFHAMNVNVRLVLDRTDRLEKTSDEHDTAIKKNSERIIVLENRSE